MLIKYLVIKLLNINKTNKISILKKTIPSWINILRVGQDVHLKNVIPYSPNSAVLLEIENTSKHIKGWPSLRCHAEWQNL